MNMVSLRLLADQSSGVEKPLGNPLGNMPNHEPQCSFRLELPAKHVLGCAEALGDIPGHSAKRGFRLGLPAKQNDVRVFRLGLSAKLNVVSRKMTTFRCFA